MFLGIEIGGTKLQFGVGRGDGSALAALQRLAVQPEQGAQGIRQQIQRVASPLIERYGVTGIAFGFGGPVDAACGRTILSHQIEGWKDFPLADWARETFGLPALVANDSDSAGVAEARFGGGQGHRVVFYSNVGSGIGGALVIEGRLYQGGGSIASELGHLRPGIECEQPDQTVESLASGWAITGAVRRRLAECQEGACCDSPRPLAGEGQGVRVEGCRPEDAADLLERCEGCADRLTTQIVAQAAAAGNRLARETLDRACRVYGWGLAQMITLLAPNAVVVGGGVSLIGEPLWLQPLREYVRSYVFPPLDGTFAIVPARLGEAMVVHGVLALAAETRGSEAR